MPPQYYSEGLDVLTAAARANGKLNDDGIVDVGGSGGVSVVQEKQVHRSERGAVTRYWELQVDRGVSWEQACSLSQTLITLLRLSLVFGYVCVCACVSLCTRVFYGAG